MTKTEILSSIEDIMTEMTRLRLEQMSKLSDEKLFKYYMYSKTKLIELKEEVLYGKA